MIDLPQIGKDYEALMREHIGGRRLQNNLRASSLGFACDRHHYYSLTEYRPVHDWRLQSTFEQGNVHEKDVEKYLREMGYEVQGMQSDFRLEKPLVTARIDGELRKNSPWYPYDAKSCSPWTFDEINSAEDVIHNDLAYVRNYATQILLYMLLKSAEYGCLLFKNKLTGELKDIWFSFDQHVGILDESLKRADRVYKAVADKKPGERTEDRALCNKCDFKDICLPDLLADGGIAYLDSADLAYKLDRRFELEDAADEYAKLDKEIKDVVKQTGEGEKTCGDYMLQVKKIEATRKVPLTWTEEKNSYFRVNIAKIGGKK